MGVPAPTGLLTYLWRERNLLKVWIRNRAGPTGLPLLSILHHPIHYPVQGSDWRASTIYVLLRSHGLSVPSPDIQHWKSMAAGGNTGDYRESISLSLPFCVRDIVGLQWHQQAVILKHRRYIWHQHVSMFMRISFFLGCTNHSRALPSLLWAREMTARLHCRHKMLSNIQCCVWMPFLQFFMTQIWGHIKTFDYPHCISLC